MAGSHVRGRSPLVTIQQANLISPETLPIDRGPIRKSARIKASAPLKSVGLRLRGAPAHFQWPCVAESPAPAVGGRAKGSPPAFDTALPEAPAPSAVASSMEEPTEDAAALEFFDHLGIRRGPYDHHTLHMPSGLGAAPAGSVTALLYCHESLHAEQSAPSDDEARCWVDSHLDQWQASMEWRSEVASLCEEWLSASPTV